MKQVVESNPAAITQSLAGAYKALGDGLERLLEADATPTPPKRSDWLTRQEAADYAKVSTDTIDNWCARGYIEKYKLGGGKAGAVRIPSASLEKFIRSRIVNRPKRVRHDHAPSVKGGYRA